MRTRADTQPPACPCVPLRWRHSHWRPRRRHIMPKTKSQQQLQTQKTTAPAAVYDNPWLEAAAEAGSEFGKLLKFNKGEWLIGDDIVPVGTEYIAYIDELARGWV